MKHKYKVVKKRSRTSAMINGNSLYSLVYKDRTDVWARKDTLGIFVFETLHMAEDWTQYWNQIAPYNEIKDLTILKVLPLARGKRANWIAKGITTAILKEFYKGDNHLHYVGESPERTMTYPGIHVIKEVIWD